MSGTDARAVETEELSALLHDRRVEALRRRDGIDASLTALRSAREDTAAADDEHDPEGATAVDEWARLTGLRRQADAELADIDAAQARLDGGGYGVCESCGRAIPVERMRVLPSARRCVPCASARP